MYARVHTLQTTEEQFERGLKVVRDDLLPWARESSGFCGLIGLTDREAGRTLVITLWKDEESATASADAAVRLGELADAYSGATRVGIDSYEVTLFDIVV